MPPNAVTNNGESKKNSPTDVQINVFRNSLTSLPSKVLLMH